MQNRTAHITIGSATRKQTGVLRNTVLTCVGPGTVHERLSVRAEIHVQDRPRHVLRIEQTQQLVLAAGRVVHTHPSVLAGRDEPIAVAGKLATEHLRIASAHRLGERVRPKVVRNTAHFARLERSLPLAQPVLSLGDHAHQRKWGARSGRRRPACTRSRQFLHPGCSLCRMVKVIVL